MTERAPILLLILSVAGCAGNDPFARPGTWRPTAANEANLRASVAVPSHLVRGASVRGSDGALAAAAVARVARGEERALISTEVARVGLAVAPAAGLGAAAGQGGF